MDIFYFIDSKDIAESLAFILNESNGEYEDLPLAYAWLIWYSKEASCKARHGAWKELIDTMPDVEIPPRGDLPGRSSLHEFLNEYMAQEKARGDALIKNADGAVYQYAVQNASSCGEGHPQNAVYSGFSSCRAAAKEQRKEKGSTVLITKLWPEQKNYIKAVFDDKVERLLYIFEEGICDPNPDLSNWFLEMWFSFPTPFERGDIVQLHGSDGAELFVLESISTWPKYKEPGIEETGFTYDMSASVLCMDHEQMFRRVSVEYMQLEYNSRALEETERPLKILSDYLHGNINFGEMMAECSMLEHESDIRKIQNLLAVMKE